MKRFAYQGKTRDGRGVRGVVEVENRELAVAQLRNQGYIITSLKEAPKSTTLSIFEPRGALKAKFLAIFCRQFAIMLGTGLSLVNSLQLLAEQSMEKRLSKALDSIRLDVSSGASFTRALEKHRGLFPNVFIHLVEAGEVAGALPEVLDRLAIYYEREDELRKKISEALMYPAIVTSVSVIMVFVLLFFVLPMLIRNFTSFGVEPPALTQAVLNGRDWMVANWYIVLGILVLVGVLLRMYLQTPTGRGQKDALKLKLPAVGELQKMVIFSRFCRTLGLLLNSGISMVQSMSILERLIDNTVVSRALTQARHGVERGQGISTPLGNHPVFPKMLVQMIAIGEETGSLEKVLNQLADFYDREVNFAVASLTKLLEPAVMLVLAVVVLFILLSVYLPMMQMVTNVM
ncbi:MAG: type II secretion system F family protein [Limnochordia bacterium]|jgi:type IV pilus assembly protein PilC